jgi:hypothetical protein
VGAYDSFDAHAARTGGTGARIVAAGGVGKVCELRLAVLAHHRATKVAVARGHVRVVVAIARLAAAIADLLPAVPLELLIVGEHGALVLGPLDAEAALAMDGETRAVYGTVAILLARAGRERCLRDAPTIARVTDLADRRASGQAEAQCRQRIAHALQPSARGDVAFLAQTTSVPTAESPQTQINLDS